MGQRDGLFQHGIAQDESDFRIHVYPVSGVMVMFDTAEARRIAKARQQAVIYAHQPGIKEVTGAGVVVPLDDFESLIQCEVPFYILKKHGREIAAAAGENNREAKGKIAEAVVIQVIKEGAWPDCPLRGEPEPVGDRAQQHGGLDLKTWHIGLGCQVTVQVKWDAFLKKHQVYIQTEESNPRHLR